MARGQKKRYGMKQYNAHLKRQEGLAKKFDALHERRKQQAEWVLNNIFESINADRGLASTGKPASIENASITEMRKGKKYSKKARDSEYLISMINISNDPVVSAARKIAKRFGKGKLDGLGKKERELLLAARIVLDRIRLRAVKKDEYLEAAKRFLPKPEFSALVRSINDLEKKKV